MKTTIEKTRSVKSGRRWCLVSFDGDTDKMDIWQCNEKGERIMEEMMECCEIFKDALKNPCETLISMNKDDHEALGFFVLDSVRMFNHHTNILFDDL